MKQCHYTYYSYEEWGRGYIGKRSCKCKPEEDVKYFGSYTDKTFQPTQKIILETHDTAEEALDAEIKLQRFFKVVENSHFANQAYQTSTKFSYVMTSEEARNNTIKINQNRTAEQRKEISRKAGKVRMASITPEQRSKLAIKANSYKTAEQRRESARKVFANWTSEQLSERARKAHASRTLEQRRESARKGKSNMTPEQRSEAARKGSNQKWQCIETGFISSPGGLSNYQKARGIDTSKRIRIN